MVGARNVIHVYHVNRKTVQLGAGLEDPSISDTATFTVAQPTRLHPNFAARLKAFVGVATGAVRPVEPIIEFRIERSPLKL